MAFLPQSFSSTEYAIQYSTKTWADQGLACVAGSTWTDGNSDNYIVLNGRWCLVLVCVAMSYPFVRLFN